MVSSSASVTSASSSSTRGSTSSSGSAPKPMPMAIMRNAHEVIRGAMGDIQDLLDKDDFETAKDLWHRFHRFSDLHMKMEEGRKGCNAKGLFALIDEHQDKAAKKAGLRDHHKNLYELEDDMVDIFERAPDIQRAKDIFPIFRKENEDHLKEEEDVLMPAIQKMMKSGVPLKKYIKTDILPVLLEGGEPNDMEFFLTFGNQILEHHEEGQPRVRVWNHAFWAVAANDDQWKDWSEYIQEALSPEKYAEVHGAIRAFEEELAAKQKAKKEAKAAKEVPPVANVDASKAGGLFSKLTSAMFTPKSAQ